MVRQDRSGSKRFIESVSRYQNILQETFKKKREREKCRSICKVIAQVPRSANEGEKGVTRLLGKCIAGKIRIGDEG